MWMLSLIACLMMMSSSSTGAFENQDRIYPGRDNFFELSVIHLNDFHARFLQTSPNSGICSPGFEEECVGGIARVHTASHQLVNERPNAIFLNAGDNFAGTDMYNVNRWNITATFLNMLPQAAMTIGNHEFEFGIAGLVHFLDMVKTPVVVANIDDSKEPDIQTLYTNSTIIERNGTKIGVIGVIISTANKIASTEELRFLDEVETVNAEAERLKEQGIDIIVVLSHCGLDVDRVIAADCPNVDLIVGGHSHTFLYSGTPPHTDVPKDEYPVEVIQERTNRTVLIVQAAAYSKYLGNISVWFDAAGEVVDWEGNPILLDKSVKQSPEVLAALVPWQAATDEFNAKLIGHTKSPLINNCRFGECNLGNLLTDAMVDAYINIAENRTYWTYAAIACANAGEIHTQSIDATGNITFGDAVAHSGFGHLWDVLELLGSDLIQVLEESVIHSDSPVIFNSTRFLQWSGIRVTFNLENEPYSRVTGLKIRCRACEVPVYEDVILNEWYRIVVPSYLLWKGGGNKVLKNKHRNLKIGTLGIDHYVRYIEKMSPLSSEIEGRIIFNGTWHG